MLWSHLKTLTGHGFETRVLHQQPKRRSAAPTSAFEAQISRSLRQRPCQIRASKNRVISWAALRFDYQFLSLAVSLLLKLAKSINPNQWDRHPIHLSRTRNIDHISCGGETGGYEALDIHLNGGSWWVNPRAPHLLLSFIWRHGSTWYDWYVLTPSHGNEMELI